MAFIHCPHCGREVSDLAHKCPGCGHPLDIYKECAVFCKYCGEEILPDEIHGNTAFCVSCRRLQQVELTNLNHTKLLEKDKKRTVEIVYSKKKNPFYPTQTSHSPWIRILVIVALLGILIITRPNKQKHSEKIQQVIMKAMQESDDMGTDKVVTAMFGSFFVGLIIDGSLQIDDYVFFNIGRINYGHNSKTVTIGVLNNVFPLVSSNRLLNEAKKSKSNEY